MSNPTSTSKNLFATVFFSVTIYLSVGAVGGILATTFSHRNAETELRSACLDDTRAAVQSAIVTARREVFDQLPTPIGSMEPGEYTGKVFSDGTALLTKVGSKCLQYGAGFSSAERSRGIIRVPLADNVGGWAVHEVSEVNQNP